MTTDRLAALLRETMEGFGWSVWTVGRDRDAFAELAARLAAAGVTVAPQPAPDALRAAAQNLTDRRTLMDDGFWVSQKEMRALDEALGRGYEYRVAQPAEEDVSDALWARWTGGERLAYGMGYRRGQAAQPAPDARRLTDLVMRACDCADVYGHEEQIEVALRAALGDER